MLITTIHQFESLQALKDNGVDAILIGIPHYSIRHCIEVSLQDLPKWREACAKLNLKLYINFLKFCHEDQIEDMKKTLSILKENQVDGIYYGDEGVFYEAKKINLSCIYQPETLITSSYDINFYLNNGAKSVSLAHELSLDEICEIAQVQPNFEILLSGYYSILYSRRPLLSNYFQLLKLENNKKSYTLIEQTRQGKMPIIEDENGTYIFSEEPMQSYEEFETLRKLQISRYRIDSIFFDDQWTLQVLQSYQKKLKTVPGSNRWYYQESIQKKEKNL